MGNKLLKLLSEAYLILRLYGPIELANRTVLFLLPNSAIFRYRMWKLETQSANETDASPFKTLWVDPNNIVRCTGTTGSGNASHLDHTDAFETDASRFGSVEAGEWDLGRCEFHELAVYRGIEQRYAKGKSWQETTFFNLHMDRIDRLGESFGATSKSELLTRLEKTDMIYQRIRKDGYKSQRELGGWPHREIVVNIGRDGEFLFNGGGRHRLSIAKVLNIDQVPVVVLVRHQQWQATRDELAAGNHLSNDSVKLNHPDLQDVQQLSS